MIKTPIKTFVLLFVCFLAKGQSGSLSLQDAIDIGLKNNFSIQIATNDAQIAINNNTVGNAGFLPGINVNGGLKENISSVRSTDKSGVTNENTGQKTGSGSLGASLDWTLFNGFGMFIRKEKLGSLQSLQQTALRATVENVVSEIVVAYFTVVQLKNSLQVLQNAIDFSNKRYDLTRKKLQIGSTSELAFLKSSTDLNADSAAFLRQKVTLANAKSKLSTILVLDAEKDLDVSSPIEFNQIMDFTQIKQSLREVNSQISLARQSVELALLDYRLTNSPKYPQIDFFTDYNFSTSTYNWGSTDKSRTAGPVFGLTLSLPVFDGFNKRRISGNAKIEAESTKLEFERILKSTEATIWQIYNEYQNNLKLVKLETANLQVARHTSKISFERFRVGEMSDYELRNIQLSELEAENSLIIAQFQAKKSETELLRLSGKLIETDKSK
jgi:outer membrane protein TolC